jgi:ABC-type multidrug transport system ATPase subunit
MKITLNTVDYRYKSATQNALEQVSFQVDASEPLGIVGKNGSGKTTLLKILVQQNINYTGDYLIDDVNPKSFNGDLLAKFQWGYLPEDLELDGRLTGYETASIIGSLRDLTEEQIAAEIAGLKKRLRIDTWFETKMCKEYSAGMKRKVGLLIAFLGHRRLVILDEPTNFLDVLTVLELKNLIRERINEGVGIIISSHIVDFIASLVDRIIVLNNGRIQYDGKLSQLHQENPDKPFDTIFIDLLNDAKDAGDE